MANSLLPADVFGRLVLVAAQESEKLSKAHSVNVHSQWDLNWAGTVWVTSVYDKNIALLWRRVFRPDEVIDIIRLPTSEVQQWLIEKNPDLFKPTPPPPEKELTDKIDDLLDEARKLHTKVGELLNEALTYVAELAERNKYG
jgi:hypothetical protein